MRPAPPTRPRAVGEWGRPGERHSDDEGQLASRTAWLAREVPGRPVAQRAAVARNQRPAIAVMTDGSVHAYARAAFYAGLAAWAWEELVSGVNWVRRALGAAGLIYVVDKVAAALRA
jgi:hypothetical protein